ncbi:MAG: dNTP triphosphohydrolase [Bacteroidales bacterium]|nr:dNTP triphosphohydrolase [Bacteroidales bacterium]
MEWGRLISSKRFGLEDYHDEKRHNRTRFQRDYDRLIFSAPFRRLQNKTQVFPLPGSVFVHNRLTHSLEVSSVGRSLGSNIASYIEERTTDAELLRKLPGIPDIVATACLAHDMGNPPFGHSGEMAIGSYFSEGKGLGLRGIIGDRLWNDLSHFEGNANAFRLLTHDFKGRRKGGFALTYSTLASIVKYPYESTLAGKKHKFGFFVSEEEHYKKVATELGILDKSTDERVKYCRHPLVYLVEAADDICYQIMDIEDSHKLKILTTGQTKEYLLSFFEGDELAHVESILSMLEDKNEQVAYLRSSIVGLLVDECSRAFIEHEDEILRGECKSPLIDLISDTPRNAYRKCSAMAYEKIYNYSGVLDIELAGNQIVTYLLERLVDAVLHPDKSYSKLLLAKVPQQYDMQAPDIPSRIQAVTDYISGMTDVYALDLYQKLNGMSLPVI